ncbi:hypothetical protein PDJAM_G00102750 [Pangasius djambal]|uniref:Uncharacterized protein n=1 Tax=Pangasius djambal TaxID=1691987 RepID=A0ACC5Y0G0_9TELE|nr:hypothetical protein [Pangasius djambal]
MKSISNEGKKKKEEITTFQFLIYSLIFNDKLRSWCEGMRLFNLGTQTASLRSPVRVKNQK